MTTVIWDGERVATDSRAVSNFINQGRTPKFVDNGVSVAVIAGHFIEAMQVAEWLVHTDADPEMTPDIEDAQVEVLWFTERGSYYVDGSLMPYPVTAPYALGSGGAYALGALAAGASVEDCIEVASRFDIFTDNQVNLIDIDYAEGSKRKTLSEQREIAYQKAIKKNNKKSKKERKGES